MHDRRESQASHAARIGGISARERGLIVAALALLGVIVVALALPGDDVPSVSRIDASQAAVLSPQPVVSAVRSRAPATAQVSSSPILPTTRPDGPWGSTAEGLEGANGTLFAFWCPPDGTLGPIWGTSVYTDTSSVCTAAVHVALIRREQGGNVRIAMADGLDEYTGHSLNGVTSQSAGHHSRSFTIQDLVPTDLGAPWNATAERFRGRIDEVFEFPCPPGVMLLPIWGIDVYTDDSAVCSAAVHAGIITRQDGGTVQIVVRPGLDSYGGTTRNGHRSDAWEAWDGSYRFSAS
jgi:hypothetical protein